MFRKPVKSSLLLLVIVAVSLSLLCGMACQNASIQTQDTTRQAVGAGLRLDGNESNRTKRLEETTDKITHQPGYLDEGELDGVYIRKLETAYGTQWYVGADNSFDSLLMDDIEKLAVVPGISDYNVTTKITPVNPVNFTRIEDPDNDQYNDIGGVTLTRTMPEQLRVLFNLAVFSGLRKGEMLALQWSDIDFENSTVSVTKAAAVVDGKQVCKAPKTKNSRREVSIPRFLTDRLHSMMVEQTKTKESLGAYWKGSNWLFTQSDGSMMSYSTPYATFQDAIDRYNADKEPADQLPHIPFHGLRHTSATLLIAAHQDVRTVSNRLGHAQASTTMNIYAHALKENDRTASNALENMLCKTGA